MKAKKRKQKTLKEQAADIRKKLKAQIREGAALQREYEALPDGPHKKSLQEYFR